MEALTQKPTQVNRETLSINYYCLAEGYSKIGDSKKAEESFEKALNSNPNVEGYFLREKIKTVGTDQNFQLLFTKEEESRYISVIYFQYMKFLVKAFAFIGFVYFCIFMYMNIGLFLSSNHSGVDVSSGEAECRTEVKSQSKNISVEAKYILIYCRDEVSRRVEITKYLDGDIVSRLLFPIKSKEGVFGDGEDVFPIILSQDEVVIALSDNLTQPVLERSEGRMKKFGNFTVSVSGVEIEYSKSDIREEIGAEK